MNIRTNIPLKDYLTMKLGGNARFMVEAYTPEDVATIYKNAKARNLPMFILGGGSNVIARDEGFNGIVVRIRIPGVKVLEDTPAGVLMKVGAGELWDNTVRQTVDMGLTGIEAMSAIPGTSGAAPVQNVGAYGQEIADTLVSLEAYDTESDSVVTLSNEDCGFSYRHSIFRGEALGHYIITSITIKLSHLAPKPPFYETLQRYLDELGITDYTPQIIRDAVIQIRSEKLPDPKITPNTGSFFKNALVEEWQVNDLHASYPDMPAFAMGEGMFKVPTGWLIERAGFKGKLLHGMRVHDKNTLVLINESATGYGDLEQARQEIIDVVRDTFRIRIEQEPLEM